MTTRFYRVSYVRNMAGGKRLLCNQVRMSEKDLKDILLDTDSKWQFVVIDVRLDKLTDELDNLYEGE